MLRIHRLVLTGLLAIAGIPAFAETGTEDPVLNRAAYSALLRNDELSDLNIGVRVLQSGTAILWGNASAPDVAKAEAVLKKLPGIKKVVNTCDAVPVSDPLVERVGAAYKLGSAEPSSPLVQAAGTTPVSRQRVTAMKPEEEKLEPSARLRDPEPLPKPLDYA